MICKPYELDVTILSVKEKQREKRSTDLSNVPCKFQSIFAALSRRCDFNAKPRKGEDNFTVKTFRDNRKVKVCRNTNKMSGSYIVKISLYATNTLICSNMLKRQN